MYKYICFFIFLLTLNVASHSSIYPSDCLNYSRNYYQIVQCMEKKTNVLRQELKNVYEGFEKKDSSNKLNSIKNIWFNYVQDDCDFYGSEVSSGNEYLLIYEMCQLRHFKQRLAQLKFSYTFDECATTKDESQILNCLNKEQKEQKEKLKNDYQEMYKNYQFTHQVLLPKRLSQIQRLHMLFIESECRNFSSIKKDGINKNILYSACIIKNIQYYRTLLKRPFDASLWLISP